MQQGTRACTGDPIKSECWEWTGSIDHYQEQAALMAIEAGIGVMPWSWVEPWCGTKLCMEPQHLTIRAPQRLEYPSRICIYCGCSAGTRDHLLPRTITGDSRSHILTVPACGECNALISDRYAPSITERREIAHAGLRRKYRKALASVEYTDQQLAEFGPGLRPFLIRARSDREAIQQRLGFPDDDTYDIRYLGKSGIDNPHALGLLRYSASQAPSDQNGVTPK